MASLPNLGLGLWAPTSLKYSPAQGPWKWISPLVHLLGVICSPSSNSKILKHPFLLKTFSDLLFPTFLSEPSLWDITITNWKLFLIPLESELRITSYGFKYQLLSTKFPSHPVYFLKGQELQGFPFFWNHSNHRLCAFLHLLCGEIFYFFKKRESERRFSF